MRVVLAACVLTLCAFPAQAQTPDTRWSPWLGCWELVPEEAPPSPRLADPVAEPPSEDPPPRICVTPAADGARFETTVPGQPPVEYTIVPNGSDRPVSETDCQGTQRSEWSRDGQRLFGHAKLTCASDRTPRQVSNVAMLAPDGQWLDVQSVTVAGRESVRVRRYRRVGAETAVTVGALAAARLDVEDVKEAAGKLSPLVLEAALVEVNAGFNLTSKAVVDLAAAGVGERVIDVMVALSYPDRFVVERTSREPMSVSRISHASSIGWAYGHAIWYDDFYFYPYSTGDIGVIGGGGSGGGGGRPPAAQPTGAGRVVDGLGYTRVRPRDPDAVASSRDGSGPTTATTASTASTASAGTSSTSSSSSSSSSGSSGSSGSSASPSGFTSGGSNDSGRTAVPR
jgi:hypothetical protein